MHVFHNDLERHEKRNRIHQKSVMEIIMCKSCKADHTSDFSISKFETHVKGKSKVNIICCRPLSNTKLPNRAGIHFIRQQEAHE